MIKKWVDLNKERWRASGLRSADDGCVGQSEIALWLVIRDRITKIKDRESKGHVIEHDWTYLQSDDPGSCGRKRLFHPAASLHSANNEFALF
jgi:hypothetical protein